MTKDQADKKNDEEVLRAKDIMPPYNKIPREQRNSLNDVTPQQSGSKAKSPETLPPAEEDTIRQKSEIPQFDLANQILSEQRKIAAIKRQRPGQKNEAASQKPKVSPATYTIRPPPVPSLQEQIIADIVARDIRELRKSIT